MGMDPSRNQPYSPFSKASENGECPCTSSWTQPVFSMDHKIVGLQYFFTAFAMAIIGGLLSMLMRLELAWPSTLWPSLQKLFPVGMQNGIMSPEFYLGL